MRKISFLLLIFGIVVNVKVVAFNELTKKNKDETVFHCEPISTVGFDYNRLKDDWESTTFRPNSTYVISPSNSEHYQYEVAYFEENRTRYICKNGISEYGYLLCGTPSLGGVTIEFKFNALSKRYIVWGSEGYYNVLPDKDRSRIISDQIKENQKLKDETGASLPNITPPTEETSDTPFIEIGKCRAI